MKSVKDAHRVPDYPGSDAGQLPATAGGTRPAVPRGMTTLVLLRDARATGETIAAVDHLLQLGYAPSRAERASQPYADPVTRAYRLLSRADHELVRLLTDKLGRGWRIAWERGAGGEAAITLELRS